MSNRSFLPEDPSPSNHHFDVKVPVAVKIAGIYLVIGLLWTFFSDPLLSLLLNRPLDTITPFQTCKGWFYGIATAGMLYWLINQETEVSQQATVKLEKTLAELLTTREALQTSEERYRQIVEVQTDLILRSTSDTAITFANATLCRALGQPLEQIVGMKWSNFVPPEDFNWIHQKIAALSPENPTFENVNSDYRANGQVGWTQWVNLGIFNAQGELLEIQSVGRDITTLHQTEDALRDSERRFRALVENASDIVVILDSGGNFCYASPSAQIVLGYSEADVLGKSALEFVHPEDANIIIQTLATALVQPNVSLPTVQYRVRHRNGMWRNFEAVTRNLLAEEAIDGIVINCRDVTDRQQAENALRNSEERFRAFMDNSPASAWITDSEGRIEYVSQAYSQMFQVPDNLVGQSILDLYRQDIAQPYLENIQTVVNTGKMLEAIESGIRADGSLGQFLVYKFPLPQPDGRMIVGGVAVDVTDRKQAESALRASEERYRNVVETILEGVWIIDTESYTSYVNLRMAEMLGYTVEEMLGKPLFYFMDDEGRAISNRNLERRRQGIREQHDFRFQTKTGQDLWALISTNPLHDDAGNYLGSLGMITDITDRKRTEAALYQREQEFRALAENAPDIIARFDRSLRHLYVNPAITAATGLLPQSFIGKTNQELGMPAAQVALWDATLTRVFTTGEQQYLEFQFSTPEGLRDYQSQCVPEFAADGSVASLLVIARNITEQKQLEQALRQRVDQEQTLSRVLQTIRQSLSLDLIFRTATAEIAQLVQADRAAVVQYLPERQCWKHVSEYRHTLEIPDTLGMEIPDQGNPLADQLKQFKVIRIDSLDTLEDEINREFAQSFPGSWLLVPLIVDQKLWGSFSMFRLQQTSAWTQEEANLVQTIAVQLSIAIQQAQAFEQAQTELVERQQAERHLRAALAEKEVLLKEIHHRVKNNLQIVSGLLQLQAQSLNDPQVVNALKESQNRVESMSLIHKKLYTSSDLGHVDVADYIHSLTVSLLMTYQISPGTVGLNVEVEPMILSLDQAIPCGLIINELISNALKYAFPNNRSGEISVKFRQNADQLELTIQDNGIGLPDYLDWQNAESLGFSLVYALVTEQLDGNLTVDRSSGTQFTIKFPQSLA